PEFTWEREDYFKSKYPHLFSSKKKTSKKNKAPGRRSHMDLFAFIYALDATKVKFAECERREDEPSLLETTVGCIVPLLLVAPDRTESELEASVDRLFDEGGSGNQTE
ncbi:hypothetical protein Tco_1342539, partial [Tanacetum coccineum]